MRRYVAFTMALVVASALLAGCSSKDKTEDRRQYQHYRSFWDGGPGKQRGGTDREWG